MLPQAVACCMLGQLVCGMLQCCLLHAGTAKCVARYRTASPEALAGKLATCSTCWMLVASGMLPY